MDCCSPWSIVQNAAAGQAGRAFWKYQTPAMKWWSAVHAEVIINLSIKQKNPDSTSFLSSSPPLGQVGLISWYLLQLGRDLQAQTKNWAVLCCLGARDVQSCCWNYNGQSGHSNHHSMTATSINVICNIMHILELGHICKMLHHDAHLWHCCRTVRPDSQRVSSQRFPIGQVFPGLALSHFIHAHCRHILTVLASPPHFPHEKEQYQCPA